MRISLIQTDIAWENKTENLKRVEAALRKLPAETDIAVLPEMFSTGFSMNSRQLAEPPDGDTLQQLRQWSEQYGTAIAGSYICTDNGRYFNRAFFLSPEGTDFHYDKRHLFRMGEEPLHFSAGDRRCIFRFRGWNICLNVCYDLRFPVWLRNRANEYDLLIFTANWPSARTTVWDLLLRARAIENQCYVCGVNRTGKDGNGLTYSGHSALLDAKGECLTDFQEEEEGIRTVEIDLDALRKFREKFPVWKDADRFDLL